MSERRPPPPRPPPPRPPPPPPTLLPPPPEKEGPPPPPPRFIERPPPPRFIEGPPPPLGLGRAKSFAPRLPRLACPRFEKSLAFGPSPGSKALPPPGLFFGLAP